VAAWAQQRVPVIGYLNGNTEIVARPFAAAFRLGLGEQGYVEGRNVEILYRWAKNRNERLPSMATDLVSHRVDLIFASAGPSPALAAKAATTTIPIVFQNGSDPVKLGLVVIHMINARGCELPSLRRAAAERLET
jgi:putative tryptophan/tyrosine transport system substrate-binding protein